MKGRVNSAGKMIALGALIAFTAGCSHPLVIKNIESYRVSSSTALSTQKTIGIVPSSANYDDQVILNNVVDNLRRYSGSVIKPYAKNGGKTVDVVANINLRSQYDGAGINFLIDWPGFLIWTPAWNGYIYKIQHDFSIRLEDGVTESHIDTFSIPVTLDVRHASMKRTWLAESGWWMPGWSISALIGGIIHTSYDPNVTFLAAKEAAAPIGEYVAQEIVRRIPAEAVGTVNMNATKTNAKEVSPTATEQTLESSLRELNRLKEDGLITQDEYDAQRKALLEKY